MTRQALWLWGAALVWSLGVFACHGAGEVSLPAPKTEPEQTSARELEPRAAPATLGPAVDAPAGWSRWKASPEGCTLLVPGDIQRVEPLSWRRCSGVPGCEFAPATWARRSGWGYGGLLTARRSGSGVQYAVSRNVGDDWWEVIVFENDRPSAAWRMKDWGDGGLCRGSPRLSEREATFSIFRSDRPFAPVVLIGGAADLPSSLSTRLTFEQPHQAVVPRGIAYPFDRVVVIAEQNGRYAIRDRDGAATRRYGPPPGVSHMSNLQAHGGSVFFVGWHEPYNSVWVHRVADGRAPEPFLAEPGVSFDELATDGRHLVWLRSTQLTGKRQFARYELQASAFTADRDRLEPKRLAELDLPGIGTDVLSVGEGWVLVRAAHKRLTLIRIADGARREVPAMPGVIWRSGPLHSQLIDGKLWLQGYAADGPGNVVTTLARFVIDELDGARR